MIRPMMITNIFKSCDLLHNLFKVSSSSIKQAINHTFWHLKMTWISEMPFSILIFNIHNSDQPICLIDTIFVDTTLHTNEEISFRSFMSCMESAVFSAYFELWEACRHIWNSWQHLMIWECCRLKMIWSCGDNMGDCLRFWLIRGSNSEMHNLWFWW